MQVVPNVRNHPSSLDALIVGAGFSGVYLLHHLRKLGYSVKVFEAGSDLGGVWYWNCYPGARVDSTADLYQLSIEEIWKDWSPSELYPGWREIREYFHHLDDKLDLRRDIQFNTRVVAAEFDLTTDRWSVSTQDGTTVHPRYLLMCTGFASKPYTPDLPGLSNFQGVCYHTAAWPQEGVDLRNKRVGVIGTGASGVQVTQEASAEAAHLTVFQRTPNLAVPMGQRKLDTKRNTKVKELYPVIFRRRLQTFTGHDLNFLNKNTFDATPEERRLLFEEMWERGGFSLFIGGYQDIVANQAANDEVYAFWRQKVRERLHDTSLHEKLAPTVPPHPFGAKRISLEQNYYEVFNQPNVNLVDINQNPIVEITPQGIRTSDGTEHKLDVLVFATGFDAVTGSMTQIDIKGTNGVSIRDKWGKGATSYLGTTTANFPNLFFSYALHGPTAFCNGPTCIEIQGTWIIDCMEYLRTHNLTRIEASAEAEAEWTTLVHDLNAKGLLGKAKSWYMGANIPGKKVEPMNFTGGIPMYIACCRECAEKDYEGFILSGPEVGIDQVKSNGQSVTNDIGHINGMAIVQG